MILILTIFVFLLMKLFMVPDRNYNQSHVDENTPAIKKVLQIKSYLGEIF